MKLSEFNALIGQNSYVRCQGKKRIDNSIVDEYTAEQHLINGGSIGWWVRSGYIIVDIDEGKEEALQIIKALKIRTLMSKTPKGLHLYFKSTEEYPQRVGMVLPFGLKCDFRCANKGYVILPFGDPDRVFNKCRTIAELPDVLTPLMNCKESLLHLKEGDGRNSTLFQHLITYKNRGADKEEIETMAELINQYVFQTPMSSRELLTLINSIHRYEAKEDFNYNPYIVYSQKGNPVQINYRAVTDYFVNKGGLFAVGSECYQYKQGAYRQAGSDVRNIIKNMVGEDKLIIQSKLMEAYRLLIDDTRIQRSAFELNADKNLINFKNGIWNIKERKLLEHDSKYLQSIQIPHNIGEYVPFTQTRLYRFFRKTKLPKEDVKMILQYIAYCMTTDYGLKTFMTLVGKSNTGKSVLIRFVETLIGKANVASLSMHELSMRFYPAQLYGKLLNSCADNSSLPLSSIDNLKKITGGDQIMHEKKGKEPFFFTPFAKLLLSFNQLPLQLEEKSNAFYKRMRVLWMNNELSLNNEYVEDLCSEESIEEVIPYLLSLLPCKEIPHTKRSDFYVEMLRRDSDTVHAFITAKCELDADAVISKDTLFQYYIEFCTENGREGHRKHSFMRAVRGLGIEEIRDPNSRQYCWKGIKVKEE